MSLATPTDDASFRPDIEGLRAISVVAVVLFHAFPTVVPGGFTGVDVFFVISGFLITQLLLREIQRTGSFSLAEFWARRIRRILPAATVVLCAVAVLALMMPPIDPRLVGRQITAAALFYFNWRQAAQGVDYLAADERDNPLLHYWSLSVEEQFYLVWPLVLVFCIWCVGGHSQRRLATSLTIVSLLMLAGSFLLCLDTVTSNRSLAFFSTFTRGWQLLTGALVTLAVIRLPIPKPLLANVLGYGAVALLVGAVFGISETTPYPGFAALAPTAAAALLIYSGTSSQHTLIRSALSLPPLKYVGRISFSWYLWHWPLLAFGALTVAVDQHLVTWLAIAASFLLAAATYHFIECPLRFSTRLKSSPRATFALGACLVALGAGTGLVMKYFAPDTVHIGNGIKLSRYTIQRDRPIIYRDRCLLRFDDVAYDSCTYGAPSGNKTVVLMGDSHAANWFSPLDAAARKLGWRLLVRIKAACHPIDAPQFRADGTPYPECATWRHNVLAELEAARPNLVVVASNSNRYAPAAENSMLARLAAIAPALVMRDTPVLPEAPDRCLSRAKKPDDCKWRAHDLRTPSTYPKATPAEIPPNARVVDLNPMVCPDGLCRAVTDGRVLMYDNHHLTASFSSTLAGQFEQLLSAAAKGDR